MKIIIVLFFVVQCLSASNQLLVQEIGELDFTLAYHSAVVSGEKLVIMGGRMDEESALYQNPYIIFYDIETGKDSVCENPHFSGGNSSLVALNDEIVFTGGNNLFPNALWINVKTKAHKTLPSLRQLGFFDATTLLLPSKESVIEIGGWFFFENKIIGTKETRIISFDKEFPGPKLKRRRGNHASVIDPKSGNIYVLFGENISPDRRSLPRGSIEVLINNNGAYKSQLVKMNSSADFIDRKDCETVLVGDKVYIAGGQVKFSMEEKVRNINTGLTQVFSLEEKTLKSLSPLKSPRSDFHLIFFDNGLLAMGGEGNKKSGDSEGKSLSSIEFFDLGTGNWQEIGNLPIPLADFSCNMIGKDKWLIVGGHDHQGNYSNKIFLLTKG